MLTEFREKVEQRAHNYQQQGILSTLDRKHSLPHINKQSIYFDIDTELYLARITCWNSGEIQMEILSLETGQTILDEYRAIAHPQEIDHAVTYFFEKLRPI